MGPATPFPGSIREINDRPRPEKLAIYQTLIPRWVFPTFGIHPADNTRDGVEVVRFRCPAGSNAVEISVFHAPAADEPALYLHMGDTFNGQLRVLLVIINDPAAPRFDVDVDEAGRSTELGTRGRNIAEEIRALRAGLAPGQVRRGLRAFRTAIPDFERFVARMGHSMFFVEPLFYHNAIVSESYGFAYTHGLQLMRSIHQEFQPGGRYHAALDAGSPFRAPDAWQTISGRSWAIHDGILGQPFEGVQMYKRVGVDAGVSTFPDARW